jgi:hypothetical protein
MGCNGPCTSHPIKIIVATTLNVYSTPYGHIELKLEEFKRAVVGFSVDKVLSCGYYRKLFLGGYPIRSIVILRALQLELNKKKQTLKLSWATLLKI